MATRQPVARLRRLLEEAAPVIAPGAFDGLSARLVEAAGFDAVYASGGAIARSIGVPDLGLVTMTEMVDRIATIVENVDLPVVADADTGFGNALNVRRAVAHYVRAGVAALHIEDQVFPKRCGHYDGKEVVPASEMVQKIRAARDAAGPAELVLIARTDAIAAEGVGSALERAGLYFEAGADLLFVEAPRSVEEIEAIGRALPQPKLINLFPGGKTPPIEVDRLAPLGYRLVIIPGDLQRAAIRAMQTVLGAIRRDRSSHAEAAAMVSFEERERIVGTDRCMELERKYAV